MLYSKEAHEKINKAYIPEESSYQIYNTNLSVIVLYMTIPEEFHLGLRTSPMFSSWR